MENRKLLIEDLEKVLKRYEAENDSELLSVTLEFTDPTTYVWDGLGDKKFKKVKS
jgi:hypothetical protein